MSDDLKPCPICGEPLDAEGHKTLKMKVDRGPMTDALAILNSDFYHENAASNVSTGRWAKRNRA